MGCNCCNDCHQKFVTCASTLQSPLLLLIRLYWGFGFFMAGWGKFNNLERAAGFFTTLGIPLPTLTVYLVGTVEFIGGLCLILGLFARFVSVPLLITMIVALATAEVAALASLETLTKAEPFLFLLATLIILAFGAGKISVDHFLYKKYCKASSCA